MTISEESRHQLHQRLDALLGPPDAATLMAHLPPVGWADVATKRDLDHVAVVFENKLDAGLADVRTELHRELGEVRKTIVTQTWTLFLGLGSLQISGLAAVVAMAKIV